MKRNNWTWAALSLMGLVGLLVVLANRFPGALAGEDAQMRLVHSVLLLGLLGGSLVLGWRQHAGVAIKQALAWVAIILLIVIGYSYRDVFSDAGTRLQSELLPTTPVSTEQGIAYLSRDLSGHFHAEALVEGTHVRFMVDTGASDVVLSPADAERIGINLDKLNYTTPYQTANGRIYAAQLTLNEVKIGGITLYGVRASVSRGGGLSTSLLGMSFLGQLSAVEVRGERLVLRQ